jgi:hypothetical protein
MAEPNAEHISTIIRKCEELRLRKEEFKDKEFLTPIQQGVFNAQNEATWLYIWELSEETKREHFCKHNIPIHYKQAKYGRFVVTGDDSLELYGKNEDGTPKHDGTRVDLDEELLIGVLRKKRSEASQQFWSANIEPLISKLDKLLFPFWDYFKANGSWGAGEQIQIEAAIKSNKSSDLDKLIKELGKIKHKIQIESRPEQPAESGGTELRAVTKKKVSRAYENIYRTALKPWLFFNASKSVKVETPSGKSIDISGVEYSQNEQCVFLNNFIEPFLEDAIERVLNDTAQTCRESRLKPEPYINEAVDLLQGLLIDRAYNKMAEIDGNLRGKGYPQNVKRIDMSDKIAAMDQCLQGHARAATLIARGRKKEPAETEQKEKRRKVKAKKSERKFKPWKSPGDACFILDGNRILFHYNENPKDLSLKSHGKAQNLLVMLCGGVLQSCDVKSKLCSPRTKPIQLVTRANQQLNDKIRKLGFTGLPEYDIEFIRYNSRFDHYESALPIHACRDDFGNSEIRMTSRG